MTEALRNTAYAKELARARLATGTGKAGAAAIERIYVKKAKREEIRFSSWEGKRMLPRPLGLPEEALVPLIVAAIQAGALSDRFAADLRQALAGLAPPTPPAPPPATDEGPELARIERHLHVLIRLRAGAALADVPLPVLEPGAGTQDHPLAFDIEGMEGGFTYWWDDSSKGPRLMAESWIRSTPGSGQLHEITATGARMLAQGFR